MIFGLPRAAEVEPEGVEELLEHLVRVGGLDAAEALVDLRRERIAPEFGSWAANFARARLREGLRRETSPDDGRTALIQAVIDDLEPDPALRRQSLRDLIGAALDAFVEDGPAAAGRAAHEVLVQAEAKVSLLEQCQTDEQLGRQHAFRALRELDLALLESDTLGNLLLLGTRGEGPDAIFEPLGDLFQRLTNWLVIHEGDAILEEGPVAHFTVRLRRLRTLLHLVDADGAHMDDRQELLRSRRLGTTRILLARARDDTAKSLRRALCAATARACDALVRDEMVDVSDVVLAAGTYLQDASDLETLAEASMVPDAEAALLAYAALDRAVTDAPNSGKGLRTSLDALAQVANDLPVASSQRVEALRAALLDFGRALEMVAGASSLRELAEDTKDSPLASFESAVQTLAKLVNGARRRLGEPMDDEAPASGPAIRMVDICVERALRDAPGSIEDSLSTARHTLHWELPRTLANIALFTLERLARLPLDAPRRSFTSFMPAPPKEAPLPAWMPPSRTIGGFYVTRAIGGGAVGSVFVAKRTEDRHESHAEEFALKVPEYSGAAARTLSEQEFLRLFREEAGALLMLPEHENIARFVTFDVGARPKPILVMELVQGPNLDRMLEAGDLDMARAIELLDGIAAGLEAMHGAGVAHLDLKPSNVIIRDPDGLAGPALPDAPVLVDFGLAGRQIRPGCGTAEYGAPEVWGMSPTGPSTASAADIYAFGCLAYEVLTRATLFEGPNEIALITQHVAHDGQPGGVGMLGQDPRTRALSDLLSASLRREPSARATASQLRQGLAELKPQLSQLAWPLQVAPAA